MTIDTLIEKAESYCDRNNLALATLSTKIANDGKWLTKLKLKEAGCTIRRLDAVLGKLKDLEDKETEAA